MRVTAPRQLTAALKLLFVGALLVGPSACVRTAIAPGISGVIATDARRLRQNDLAAPGTHQVVLSATVLGDPLDGLPVVVYRPADGRPRRMPAVVFLPGRVAPEAQYESYARALASHGMLVAMRGWYSPLRTDPELARDASTIATWLVRSGLADPARIGVAGHSMGAKDAIMAALHDPRFRAVVALDPDDNGAITIARGPVGSLRAPLLLVGAEVAWRGWQVCAPRANNYQRFFEHSAPGTIELELRGADHVQLMDDPEAFGMIICRVGTADSFAVRTEARRATVGFFAQHLMDGPALAFARDDRQIAVRVRGPADNVAPARPGTAVAAAAATSEPTTPFAAATTTTATASAPTSTSAVEAATSTAATTAAAASLVATPATR